MKEIVACLMYLVVTLGTQSFRQFFYYSRCSPLLGAAAASLTIHDGSMASRVPPTIHSKADGSDSVMVTLTVWKATCNRILDMVLLGHRKSGKFILKSDQQQHDKTCPADNAGIISRLSFWWLNHLMLKGYRKPLELDDLYDVPVEDKSSRLGELLERSWTEEVERSKQKKGCPSFLRALWQTFGGRLLLYSLYPLILESLAIVGTALFLRGMVYSMSVEDSSWWEPYLYAVGVSVLIITTNVIRHVVYFNNSHLGLQILIACSALIYRKAIRLKVGSLGGNDTTAGEVVNLMARDLQPLPTNANYFTYSLSSVVVTVLSFIITWCDVGLPAVAQLVGFVCYMLFEAWLGTQYAKFRYSLSLRSSERMKKMKELLSGFKVIKMSAWEPAFLKTLCAARKEEVKVLRRNQVLRAVEKILYMSFAKLVMLVVFIFVIRSEESLSADKVFTVLFLCNSLMVRVGLQFSGSTKGSGESMAAVRRIQQFLMCEEDKPCEVISHKHHVSLDQQGGLTLSRVNVTWSECKILQDVSLTVNPGELIALVGAVGSGKSSLLQVILRELPGKKVAYVVQEPWLTSLTIRDNILFGRPMDLERYTRVIRNCALDQDIKGLPQGDLTAVGERGARLSGGQRARVSLARAVYLDADLYLLDDPLSALDATVSRHVFNNCILGFLEKKTRILVTHQVRSMKRADRTVVLAEGRVMAQGPYHTLQKKHADVLSHIITSEDIATNDETLPDLAPTRTTSSSNTQSDPTYSQEPTAEKRIVGTVKMSVYFDFFRMGGNWAVLVLVGLLALSVQVLSSGSEYWLKIWVQDGTDNPWYLWIYVSLVCGLLVLSIIFTAAFFLVCSTASVHLHKEMLNNILRVPVAWFHTNPIGRVLNTFGKDLGQVDDSFPSGLLDTLTIGLNVLGMLVIQAIIQPWMILPTVALAVLFHFMRRYYLCSAWELQRLEAISSGPVFSHLSNTLDGLAVIQSHGASRDFLAKFDTLQDTRSTASFIQMAASRWFGERLDMLCGVYVSVMSLWLVAASKGPSETGLAVASAAAFFTLLPFFVRLSAELDSLMVAIERTFQYRNLEQMEDIDGVNGAGQDWPSEGRIEWKNVSLKYGPGQQPVLKDITFMAQPQEKIGIVGRTGSGKSSLLASLFRLAEPEGLVLIDSLSIKEVGLKELRSTLAVIPQEPVLFSGTIRYNLDPLGMHPDSSLWAALDDVQMRKTLGNTPGGLDSPVSEGGTNWSLGQRQLLCLARAIVRNAKVVVLDEATSNIDLRTDSIIQQTIRSKFKNCTILMVAHRLSTIMDCDRVLVLDNGSCLECDEPLELLQKDGSYFQQLAKETGASNFNRLYDMALQVHRVKRNNNCEITAL